MKDKRIDQYIDKAKPFAKPILKHVRTLIHKTIPEVTETVKWSFPHFDAYGATVCSIASFKEHCAMIFWKAPIMKDKYNIFKESKEKAMGHLGRIKSLEDLPSDKILTAYLKEAAELNRKGVKLPSKVKKQSQKKELELPDYFVKAIRKNKKAYSTFEGFSYSHKKEYIEWITDAKRDETRTKRIEQAIEMMEEGKDLNWKYKK